MIFLKNNYTAIVAFFLGAASTFFFLSKETDNQLSTNSELVIQQHSTVNITLQDEVRRLEQENIQLMATLQSMQVTSSHMASSSQNEDINLLEIQQELIAYKLNEISSQIATRVGMDLKRYASDITNDFNNENKDIFWSEQEELHLRKAIDQNVEFGDIAIRDIECKSSQCKISAFSGGDEHNQVIFEKLTALINNQYENISYYSNPLENEGIKTIYIKIK